jgi:hypothetical protein
LPSHKRQTPAQRRAEFDRIHGQVLAGRTVRDLWLAYGRNRFDSEDFDSDEVFGATVKHAFYSGAAAMLELMTRVAPDDVSEDQGVEMLTRLQEELHAYANRTN